MKDIKDLIFVALLTAILTFGCRTASVNNDNAERIAVDAPTNQNVNQPIAKSGVSEIPVDVEREKPVAGKGNIQGKVLFNSAPAAGVEVKVCEKLIMIVRIDCTGATATAKTDADGIFVLSNLEPKIYGGLMARVFKSNYYVSPQEAVQTTRKFDVAADRSVFSPDIHLFKNDLKIASPKSGSKIEAAGLKLVWNEYPDAEYYKVSLYPENAAAKSPINAERVEGATSLTVDEMLTNGKYRIKIEAYNSDDRKLAESDSKIKFTVTGGTEPVAAQE